MTVSDLRKTRMTVSDLHGKKWQFLTCAKKWQFLTCDEFCDSFFKSPFPGMTVSTYAGFCDSFRLTHSQEWQFLTICATLDNSDSFSPEWQFLTPESQVVNQLWQFLKLSFSWSTSQSVILTYWTTYGFTVGRTRISLTNQFTGAASLRGLLAKSATFILRRHGFVLNWC